MGNVLVVAEHVDGALKKSAAEQVTAAKLLGGEIAAVAVGKGSTDAAKALGGFGVANAYALDGDLPVYSSDGFAAAVAQIVKDGGFTYVVLTQSQFGRDFGARLAACLGGSWINDVTAIEGGDTPQFKKPLYAGKVTATFKTKGDGPFVVTIRPKIFEAAENAGGEAAVTAVAAPAGYKSTVTSLAAKEEGQIDLKEADIIITGGRGVGGPEGFEPLRKFAKTIGTALGASRAAVDAGWIEHSHQVGQTGKVVNPQLYIACGVSGAIQHLAGMQTSKYIVAINNNENAPIFNIADYGIVGDLFEVVPELEKQISELG